MLIREQAKGFDVSKTEKHGETGILRFGLKEVYNIR